MAHKCENCIYGKRDGKRGISVTNGTIVLVDSPNSIHCTAGTIQSMTFGPDGDMICSSFREVIDVEAREVEE